MAKNLEISLLLDFYGPVLTEKQRELAEQYYNDDFSLAEIAQNEGITRQGVRDAIKRAEQQMLEMEESLGMVKRFREIGNEVAQIAVAAGEIAQKNRAAGGGEEITRLAEQIQKKAASIQEN